MPSFLVFCVLSTSLIIYSFAVSNGRLQRKGAREANRVVFESREPVRCPTDSGGAGLCVDVRRCTAALAAIRAGNRPAPCGSWVEPKVPCVCCHIDHIEPKPTDREIVLWVFSQYVSPQRSNYSTMQRNTSSIVA